MATQGERRRQARRLAEARKTMKGRGVDAAERRSVAADIQELRDSRARTHKDIKVRSKEYAEWKAKREGTAGGRKVASSTVPKGTAPKLNKTKRAVRMAKSGETPGGLANKRKKTRKTVNVAGGKRHNPASKEGKKSMATFSEKVKAREKNKVGSQHDRRKAQSSKIRDKNAARQGKVEKARGAKQLPKGSDRTARTVPSKTAKEKLAQTKAKKAAQKTASGPSPSSKKRAGASKTDYKPSSGKMASNTKTNYSLRSGLAKPGANAKDGISASTEGGGKASKVKSPVKKPKMQKFNATTAGTGTKAAPSAPNSGPQISKGKRLVRGAIRGGKSLARKTVAGAIALEAAGAISNMDKHGRENLGIKVPYPTATGSSRSRTKAAPKGDLNKVDLGMKGAVNAAQKKVNTFDATKAGTGVKRKGGGQTSAPATKTAAKKTAPKAGGTKKRGGYSYTGPKVGSDEYKAMRAKKQAGYKAKARKNIAAKRAKSATTARQQGTTAPNYQQPVMQRRVGNEHRQNTYTGDSATTNDNLAKAANSGAEAGGEEKNFWGRTFGTPKEHLGGRTRMQWLVDQAGS